MPAPDCQEIWLDAARLTDGDRRILSQWSGQYVAVTGPVRLMIPRAVLENFYILVDDVLRL